VFLEPRKRRQALFTSQGFCNIGSIKGIGEDVAVIVRIGQQGTQCVSVKL